jgi:hypothetical protein
MFIKYFDLLNKNHILGFVALLRKTDTRPVRVVREQRTLVLQTTDVHGQYFLSVKTTSCPWTIVFVSQHFFYSLYRKYSVNFPCQTKVFLRYMPY